MDLKKFFSELGLPLGLIAVVSSVLLLIGIELDQVLSIAGTLIGVPLAIALLIDVLKWAGVVEDSTAGKWSAAFNLIVLGLIVIALKAYPQFDFASVDAQVSEFVRFFALVFGYVVQVSATKKLHTAYSQGLGISWSSHSYPYKG